jgi:hypothetical protein
MDARLDTDAHAELDQTIAALEAGPTSLQPSTAIATIEFWEARARDSQEALLAPVADGLAQLKGLLSDDRLDGQAIGGALLELADATDAVVAQTDDARLGPNLERLASMLRMGGNALSGREPEPTDLGEADVDDEA